MKNWLMAILFAFSLSATPVLAKENVKKPRVVHLCKKNDTAVNILACNIYREARGESDYGKLAVGFVTLNRKDHDKFPHTVKKIVYQPGQFSWTTTSTSFKVTEQESWRKSKQFASALFWIHSNNKIVYDAIDFTKGSVYYHALYVKPYWTKVMIRTVKIDNHIFYKDKPEPQGT